MSTDFKAVITQPYFAPYLAYFQMIASCDIFIVFDDVNYINRGWINRNQINIAGKEHLISIPLSNASQNKLINQIEISEDFKKSQKKTLQTIFHSYKKAKNFEETYKLIEKILSYNERNLAKFIVNSLAVFCEYMDIDFKYKFSSEIAKNENNKGQEKILEICKKIGATKYINPIGGTELYDKDYFLKNEIKLNFLKMRHIEYSQIQNPKSFIPNLSIIDVIMNNTKNELREKLTQYDLI